eukprot:TRINITY_DN51472_c0_g1_i1.p1 TRINITY_DN51472_c0_g1~~TRINITY_DN51472_c0_g1_i1.p1  ORF type:complete len:328 (-),score=52.60 TRINITY_DN51472_c0_g1_i1:352-1335(-)
MSGTQAFGAVGLLIGFLAYLALNFGQVKYPVHQTGAIFITGVSTGIGRHAAVHLAEKGYDVFGTVRKQQDADAILESVGVSPAAAYLHFVICDVTNATQVKAAQRQVKRWTEEKGLPLVGIVNNAGVGSGFALMDMVPESTLDWVFDVNVKSVLRVYKEFLPLLRKHKGRVVNVGSLAGQAARPFRGVYSVSKFALEGLSDTLRMENKLDGVSVSMVNPGYVQSEIFNRSTSAELTSTSKKELTGLQASFLDHAMKTYWKSVEKAAHPIETSEAISHALIDEQPSTRYYPGTCGILSGTLCQKLIWLLPSRIMDAIAVPSSLSEAFD